MRLNRNGSRVHGLSGQIQAVQNMFPGQLESVLQARGQRRPVAALSTTPRTAGPERPVCASTADADTRLAKLLHPLNGTDDVREAHAELFVDHHCLAARHQLAVDVDLQGFARQFVQLHD